MKGDALKNARETLVAGALPQYLRWLQHQLESHGGDYFADNRLTIADLKVFVVLRGLSSGQLEYIPINLIETVAPKLKTHMQRIGNIPAIAQYHSELGVA
jgi:glutathione S-transferase